MYSVIQLDDGTVLKGAFKEWNEYGIVITNIVELTYEQVEDVMQYSIKPSIYPYNAEVCFSREFIISEYKTQE